MAVALQERMGYIRPNRYEPTFSELKWFYTGLFLYLILEARRGFRSNAVNSVYIYQSTSTLTVNL